MASRFGSGSGGAGAGTAGGSTIQIDGLDELRKQLKKLGSDSELNKQFRDAEKRIGQRVGQVSAVYAKGIDGPAAHFAHKITVKTPRSGGVRVGPTPTGNAAFWGAKPGKRSGWNRTSYLRRKAKNHVTDRTAAPGRRGAYAVRTRRNLGGNPQFMRWVGNRWTAGAHNEGPYAINEAIADLKPQIIEWYGDAVRQVAGDIFETN
jgi:hypothetical protein